ncbi:MAG: cytochrome c peroxidase [Planctomycetota bacterium]|jgi:cytochrome c peroxidase
MQTLALLLLLGLLAPPSTSVTPATQSTAERQSGDAGSQVDTEAKRPKRVVDSLPISWTPTVPYGLPEDLFERAPASDEVVALGRSLFFDPILSEDRSVSCSSCHDPKFGFADPVANSIGIHGQATTRNAPTLLNRALGSSFFWDGRASSLEEQSLMPISNPTEMGTELAPILARLAAQSSYAEGFRSALGGPPSGDHVGTALAAFLRRLTHGNSAVDRFRKGEYGVLSDEARAGMWIFESNGRCWKCHSGSNFSDEEFHNTGIGVREEQPEEGRFAISGIASERGAFKTPTLRGLTMTAPYMHDGSMKTLTEIVEFYREGGHPNAHLDEEMKVLEIDDRGARSLVAFLEALSDTAPSSSAGDGEDPYGDEDEGGAASGD